MKKKIIIFTLLIIFIVILIFAIINIVKSNEKNKTEESSNVSAIVLGNTEKKLIKVRKKK